MLGMWDVGDVGCSRCGMFRMWDVPDVGCSGCGMWDVDLQNALTLCQCIQSSQLVSSNTQCIPQPGHSLFQLPLSIKTKFLEYLTSHKASMIFYNDAPNSLVPAFLEFFVNALSTASHQSICKQSIAICKSHTASQKNSLYRKLVESLLLSNT